MHARGGERDAEGETVCVHRIKLLEDDLLWSIENAIADCIEVASTRSVREHSVRQTQRMVLLSDIIPVDEMLARQLARKFGKDS